MRCHPSLPNRHDRDASTVIKLNGRHQIDRASVVAFVTCCDEVTLAFNGCCSNQPWIWNATCLHSDHVRHISVQESQHALGQHAAYCRWLRRGLCRNDLVSATVTLVPVFARGSRCLHDWQSLSNARMSSPHLVALRSVVSCKTPSTSAARLRSPKRNRASAM